MWASCRVIRFWLRPPEVDEDVVDVAPERRLLGVQRDRGAWTARRVEGAPSQHGREQALLERHGLDRAGQRLERLGRADQPGVGDATDPGRPIVEQRVEQPGVVGEHVVDGGVAAADRPGAARPAGRARRLRRRGRGRRAPRRSGRVGTRARGRRSAASRSARVPADSPRSRDSSSAARTDTTAASVRATEARLRSTSSADHTTPNVATMGSAARGTVSRPRSLVRIEAARMVPSVEDAACDRTSWSSPRPAVRTRFAVTSAPVNRKAAVRSPDAASGPFGRPRGDR